MLLGFISMIYDVIIANILFMSEGVIPSKLSSSRPFKEKC